MKGTVGRTLILEYHRVSAPTRDPQLLCVAPERFADQIQALASRFEIVPLGDTLEPSGTDRVAITFDDGYVDNLTEGAPIMQEVGAPFTVFVVAGFVDTDRTFWWDRLDDLVFGAPNRGSLSLEVPGLRLWADVRTEAGRERAYQLIHRRLYEGPTELAELVLAALSQTEDQNGERTVMSTDELRELVSIPGATIGSHTVDHPMLSRLSAPEEERQVTASKLLLERATGRPVDTFAYPFGVSGTYSRRTIRALKRAGYRLACANQEGTPTRRRRFELPRFIVRDWDVATFNTMLDRWLAAA